MANPGHANDYTDLYFGEADAKTEASKEPESFIRSFVDPDGAIDAILHNGRFLALGPKGSGKSAIASYLQMTASDRDLLVQSRDVSDLPVSEVGKLKTGENAGPTRSLTAWRFILLCALVDAILEDQSSALNANPEALEVIGELRRLGFLDPTPKRAVLTATRTTFKIPIPKIGDIYSKERSESLHLYHISRYLEKWVAQENGSTNSHLVILDGLDSIYLNDPQYVPSISALVQSAMSLNQDLRGAGAKSTAILLLRNDIFSRLELPDGGKVRTDWAVEIDWRTLSGDASSAQLFNMANRKSISRSLSSEPGEEPDKKTPATRVVEDFYPPEIKLGGRGAKRKTHSYLLNLTRHTPRDLLQLFENIRKVAARDDSYSGGVLSREIIREGVLQYSTKYFVDAVRNELVGLDISGAPPRSMVDALRSLGSQTFAFEEYRIALEEILGEDTSVGICRESLKWLFFAGAIGNEVGQGRDRYLQFFHRRDDADINLTGRLSLHPALVYAWAIPWNNYPQNHKASQKKGANSRVSPRN